ncbi:MAG: DUF169 domain-containing protein [Planctomycetes bacterium]|nr:DUF169 domain-containing protein [Planctomycetota bacterium]
MDRQALGTKLMTLLGLRHSPVAVSFRKEAPAGVRRVAASGPAGCSYWRLAAEGHVFFTEAADHYNCPIGAHTHGVTLPPERAKELEAVVGTMVGLEYLTMAEVPSIPKRTEPFGVAVYAPLGAAPVDPDLVLVRGTARQVMLVAEAAASAGIGHDGTAMGRPACAMLPAALQSGRGVTSLGCIGNRVYTGLADDELYYTIPGPKLPDVAARLETILRANGELEKYHTARARTLGAAGAASVASVGK